MRLRTSTQPRSSVRYCPSARSVPSGWCKRAAVIASRVVSQSGALMVTALRASQSRLVMAVAAALTSPSCLRSSARSTAIGSQYRMHRSERNFSRCVNASPTGTSHTLKVGSPAAAACCAASRAMRATPVLKGCSMYGRKRETPSGAKPRQSPCCRAAITFEKMARLSSFALSLP